MKKGKLFLALIMCLGLTACAGKMENALISLAEPEEAVENVMESIKALDLETLNRYTDNHIASHRNFLGIPVSREYRVFNELQQPGLKRVKHYQWNKEFAGKIVENLSWEIGEVRKEGDKAYVDLVLTNKDLTDVTGIYEVNLIKGMIHSEGLGIRHLVKEMFELTNEGGDLCEIIDEMEQTRDIEVTVRLDKKAGEWQVHLSEEFIDGFMGNLGGSLNGGAYSEEIERQLEELELELELEISNQADFFGDRIERWAEGLFE